MIFKNSDHFSGGIFLSLLVFKTNEKKSSSLSINFIFEIPV